MTRQAHINDAQMEMLLSRLSWPSGMVRERTCVVIAELLADPSLADTTYAFLLGWLKRQKLESLTAYGIFPVIKALTYDLPVKISGEEIWNALGKRSILAWLLIEEIFPHAVPFSEASVHSEEPPYDFEIPSFFIKHDETFLPTIYKFWSDQIREREGVDFYRQWAYEWQVIHSSLGTELSTESYGFWMGRREEDTRCVGSDVEISEIYRSAYLRALAKFTSEGTITQQSAVFLASETCPLDLELWQIPPSHRPEWWPSIEQKPLTEMDTTPVEIWKQVEELWNEQDHSDSFLMGKDWMIAEASGFVFQSSTTFELQILGMLQKCHGPEQPNLESIAAWYSGETVDSNREPSVDHPSSLRLRGLIYPQPISDRIERFGDWTIVPITSSHLNSRPRWQYWRFLRKFWLPVSYNKPIEFVCEDNVLMARSEDKVIGIWSDWVDGIRERLEYTLPPKSGDYLLVRRDLIDELAKATNSTFCWLCCLTSYYREHSYGIYRQYNDHRIFGASHIVRI